ncbi:MAG: pantetheine-phosphate adenylyltransferase [Anaerovoracaceae bacterium]|nr:pantetheine-phosphate adenylyltransferase [Anaerovoracaceae bacterium]
MSTKALYAGSFDPLTNGHLDLIERAAKIHDELVIGVIDNPTKHPYFSAAERVEMIEAVTKHLDNVSVDSFSGLLADYVNANGFNLVVRGLRATMDFEYEIQMAQMNARLYKGCVETIFLMTKPSLSFLSSSVVKEVHRLNGDLDGLIPDEVKKALDDKKK